VIRHAFGLLLLVIAVGVTGYFIELGRDTNNEEVVALDISQSCDSESGQKRPECLSEKIISYVSKSPEKTGDLFESFWQLEQGSKLSDDARIFSDIAHLAGMALVDKMTIHEVLHACGTAFKQGCIHGAVMEYIEHQYPREVVNNDLFRFCDEITGGQEVLYLNCIHAVGHEFAAKNKIPLPAIVTFCDPLSGVVQDACVSGALMEYSKGEVGLGEHSHAPIGSVELPCRELDEKYQEICYASAGSYRQYNPNQEAFQTSYQFCTDAPFQYRDACIMAVSERALMATALHAERLELICSGIAQENISQKCRSSINDLRASLYN